MQILVCSDRTPPKEQQQQPSIIVQQVPNQHYLQQTNPQSQVAPFQQVPTANVWERMNCKKHLVVCLNDFFYAS